MTSTVAYRADDVHRMITLVKSAKGATIIPYRIVELINLSGVDGTDYATTTVGELVFLWFEA